MMTVPENDHVEVTINMRPNAVYVELWPENDGVQFEVHGIKPDTAVMALSAGFLHLLVNDPETINKAITAYMDEAQEAEKEETSIQTKS